MILNITNKLNKSGIYIIKYENGKIYIGQAINILVRAYEHNNKKRQLCDIALKKYNAEIEILEEVNDFSQLEEKEKYWINFYNSTDKNKGYNITDGGNASGKRGIENCNASFDEQKLQQVIELLLNHTELSYVDIANKFNVSQSTIYKISQGYSYRNPKLNYPLRDNNHDYAKKTFNNYFSSLEELLSLKEDLKYRWDLSIEKDLTKKYNIPLKILRDINNGRKYSEYGNYTYPIREKNIRNNNNFTIDMVINILNDLHNTNLSMTEIGKKYNIHRDTVSKINKGISYIIKKYDYPARD